MKNMRYFFLLFIGYCNLLYSQNSLFENLNKYSYEELENKFYLRKVLFIEGKGYLEAFNKDVYGKFEIDSKVKYIGRVIKQFNIRDLSNIEF